MVNYVRRPSEDEVRRMGERLRHRGPDDGRVWLEGPCGLAHRRLKIIDLTESGAQPMAGEEGGIRVVFNGEIYNHRDLRRELEGMGHRFAGRSDTEAIVHGFEQWGTGLFARLRGMFAIAVWDPTAERLVLARDRFGKKPLFHACGEGWLAFGSELSSLRGALPGSPKLCAEALRQYAEFGYVFLPLTILEGVNRLPPGSTATFDRDGLRMERYWSLPEIPPARRLEGGATEAAVALEGALRDAVACRLESEVPLGCFLSGGTDSSLVAAFARDCLPTKLRTFTVSFRGTPMDEGPYAAAASRHLGTEHCEIVVEAQSLFDEFEDILGRAGEPLGDDSFVPTYLIARETRKEVTVVLTGDGGDEVFCGYTKYRQFELSRRLRGLLPATRWLAALPLGDGFLKALDAMGQPDDLALARWLSSLWKASEVGKLLAGGDAEPGFRTDAFSGRWLARPVFAPVERFMLTDMETYMEADILMKVDRASMAVALETRSPFLDHIFFEKALQWRCRGDPRRGGKAILREMLKRRLPNWSFERPKQGFGMPIAEWYRGPLRPLLLSRTSPERLRRRGVFNPETVQWAVREHLSGRRNFARRLHAVVAFEVWADRFFGSDGGPA